MKRLISASRPHSRRPIRAAEGDKDNGLDDVMSNVSDDFDYLMSGIEKLVRSGPNAAQAAAALLENIQSSLDSFISQVADAVTE